MNEYGPKKKRKLIILSSTWSHLVSVESKISGVIHFRNHCSHFHLVWAAHRGVSLAQRYP